MSCTRPSKHGGLLDLPTTLHVPTSSFNRRRRSSSALLFWASGEAVLLSNARTLRMSNDVFTFRRNSAVMQTSFRILPSDDRIVMPAYTVCEHACAARLT